MWKDVKFKTQLLASFSRLSPVVHAYPFYRASRTKTSRDRILHSQIMEVRIALRCTGAARRRNAVENSAAFRQAKESGRSFVFHVPRRFFAGLECQNERGRDLHADLRAGSNRLISNRFGPQRVSPPFLSPLLRPLPSSSIHVHFSFFLLFFDVTPLSSPPFSFTPLLSVFLSPFSSSFPFFSAISFSLAGFLQSRHGRD